MSFYERLVYARRSRLFGKMAYWMLKLLGVEIPLSVTIGEGFLLHHGGVGVVIHPKTAIGNRVSIYPGVTLGRADVYVPIERSAFQGILVEDDVIIGAGAKVLCKEGILKIAKGSVIGANAVLLNSTSENEIWAGNPAKCIGKTECDDSSHRTAKSGDFALHTKQP
jgi:serine O-acetyltransferase